MTSRPELTQPKRNTTTRKARYGRKVIAEILGGLNRWKPLTDPKPGYSIVLGTPWALRHLLPVNLKFIQRTDRTNLHRIHVVFDRTPQSGGDAFIEQIRDEFADLPLTFRFYPPLSGWITERVSVSTFFNSMNTILALGECETGFAILHDFDLYPLVPEYFEALYRAHLERDLHFVGLEHTPFDGLTKDDNILGTWALGIDVVHLRANHRPGECFHTVAPVNGQLISLDPYSYVQLQTPRRGLVETIDGSACCHVKNLCSTYLRFTTGRWAKIAWRLHYVWYLETLIGKYENFHAAHRAMDAAEDSLLTVNDYEVDFAGTDPTCANVLRDEVTRMEEALTGTCRPEVVEYADAFKRFLMRVAQRETTAVPESVLT